MSEQYPVLTRHDLETKIVKRCWVDEEFRKEFTADPLGTALKYLQVPATSLPKIVVHEETAGYWHIVLPSPPANARGLSEQDLERVAGGSTLLSAVARLEHASISMGGLAAGAAASAVVSVGSVISGVVSAVKGW